MWPSYHVTHRASETTFQIRVENPAGVHRGVMQIQLDGDDLDGNEIPLLNDGGQHHVYVALGAVNAATQLTTGAAPSPVASRG